MTNEEVGQRIEFIIEQQAQFTSDPAERLNIFINVVEKYINRNGNNGSAK